jgi:hypothetical protein
VKTVDCSAGRSIVSAVIASDCACGVPPATRSDLRKRLATLSASRQDILRNRTAPSEHSIATT